MAWPETVRKKDVKITWFNSSGSGGQRKNKVAAACRMKHIPTGIQVTATESRYQTDNRSMAFRRLVAILVPMMKAAAVGPEREHVTEVIRTYNEHRSSVKDKRLGAATYDYRRVLDGDDLNVVIQSLLRLPSPSESTAEGQPA